MIALKIKANAALAQTASRQFNCVVTRKLPTWSPNQGWSELTPTRSIAWALADCAKSTYGAKLDDHRLDLEALFALDQLWTTRGDWTPLLTQREGVSERYIQHILRLNFLSPDLKEAILDGRQPE